VIVFADAESVERQNDDRRSDRSCRLPRATQECRRSGSYQKDGGEGREQEKPATTPARCNSERRFRQGRRRHQLRRNAGGLADAILPGEARNVRTLRNRDPHRIVTALIRIIAVDIVA
jgi:hypothetical protein